MVLVRSIAATLWVAVLFFAVLDLRAETPFDRPIYNPASKSYFELRNDNIVPGGSSHTVWSSARNRAAAQQYKGVHGRLAVVTDFETHDFLNRNFHIDDESWIGLLYWCTFRKLTWVDGSVHEPTAFSAWAQPWHRTDLPPCSSADTLKTGYMSVYYMPTPGGMRWQAVGSAKGFRQYFVEYPTGGP